MKYIVTINNKKYEVEVEKGQAAVVNTTEIAASAATPRTAPSAAAPAPVAPATVQDAPAAAPAAGGEVVKAPMPGTILEVKITTGEKVKKGTVLFILEAMKMENEIMAPVDGIVVQMNAAKGTAVSTGETLAVIQ